MRAGCLEIRDNGEIINTGSLMHVGRLTQQPDGQWHVYLDWKCGPKVTQLPGCKEPVFSDLQGALDWLTCEVTA